MYLLSHNLAQHSTGFDDIRRPAPFITTVINKRRAYEFVEVVAEDYSNHEPPLLNLESVGSFVKVSPIDHFTHMIVHRS